MLEQVKNEGTMWASDENATATAEKHSGDFSWALDRLKKGLRVYREGWNGKGMWIALQEPDSHSKMSLPYIFLHTALSQRVPWLASQTDLLAEDWGTF